MGVGTPAGAAIRFRCACRWQRLPDRCHGRFGSYSAPMPTCDCGAEAPLSRVNRSCGVGAGILGEDLAGVAVEAS
jgi:hypothetical protein